MFSMGFIPKPPPLPSWMLFVPVPGCMMGNEDEAAGRKSNKHVEDRV